MLEAQNSAEMLNPFVFHLQKLELELKCPVCLDLLNKPVLLPCDHMVCKSCITRFRLSGIPCPACLRIYDTEEIRHPSWMENIVTIYKSLDATFRSTILPLLSAGNEMRRKKNQKNEVDNVEVVTQWKPRLLNTNIILSSVLKLMNNPTETDSKGSKVHGSALTNIFPGGAELTKCSLSEELDLHAPELSPGSSPSVNPENADAGAKKNAENQSFKRSGGGNIDTAGGAEGTVETCNIKEPKRQKRLNYELPEIVPSHGSNHHVVSGSDQAGVSNFIDKSNSNKDIFVTLSTAPCDASCLNGNVCAFCQNSEITEGTGHLLHYANGREVPIGESTDPKAIPVHIKCIEWTPRVYFAGEKIKNLESELLRASKLKCSSCGLKGASLGCFAKSCRRSYHFPCALKLPDCRWDCNDFVMLCPLHESAKFPSERSNSGKRQSGETISLTHKKEPDHSNFWETSNRPQEWYLCGSALSSQEKCLVEEFAAICGATVLKSWSPNVTHVIASTDSRGACSRTLKVLMAILHGRWILTIDWIKACLEANHPVSEEPYEIDVDNHGFHGGPKAGRLRALNNDPKLFSGYNFHIFGEYAPSLKRDLIDLVRDAGGTIIEIMEQITAEKNSPGVSPTWIVCYDEYSPESPKRLHVGGSIGRYFQSDDAGHVIPHTLILESIAMCTNSFGRDRDYYGT